VERWKGGIDEEDVKGKRANEKARRQGINSMISAMRSSFQSDFLVK
jgi:hypothetical protein